ncbi:MAG TPA: type II toxin-antitoxin system death-on-curing family toxin [Candidatus Paceibacterota bacterium]
MTFPTAEDIIRLHEVVLRQTGGSSGLRDAGALEMCTARPYAGFGGTEMYPNLFTKAAATLESLARNHVFVDANKRTAFITAVYILEQNEYKTFFDQKDIEDSMVHFVVEKTSIADIAAWLEKNSKLVG